MVTRKPISVLLISVIQCYITVPIAQTCQVSLQQTAEAFSQRTDMACTSTLGINLIISRDKNIKFQADVSGLIPVCLLFRGVRRLPACPSLDWQNGRLMLSSTIPPSFKWKAQAP